MPRATAGGELAHEDLFAMAADSLRAASKVAFFATFILAGCGAGLLVLPFMYPLGYWIAVFRHRSGLAIALPVAVALFVLLVWVRRQVLHPEVGAAQLAAGLPPPRIKLALAVGMVLPLLVATHWLHVSRSDMAREAIRRAEQQLGAQYRYVLASMKVSSGSRCTSVSATVAAYNDVELRNIQVNWAE